MGKVAIVYWSGTGNTEAMANAVAEGVAENGGGAEVIQVSDFPAGKLGDYDAFAFGCPAMGSEELEDTEFQPVWDEVKGGLGDRKVVLFGSYEWAGGEWMENWKADANAAGVNVVGTRICYGAPGADDVAACRALGATVA